MYRELGPVLKIVAAGFLFMGLVGGIATGQWAYMLAYWAAVVLICMGIYFWAVCSNMEAAQ